MNPTLLREKFEHRTERVAGFDCWIWTGAMVAGGYGVFKVDGRLQYAHRISREI